MGVAHANLEHIYELRPDVIKLDRSIVSDAFSSPVRRRLIASVLTLANRLEAALVAVGGRAEDWECLRDIGGPVCPGVPFRGPGPAFRRWHSPRRPMPAEEVPQRRSRHPGVR